MCDAISMDFLIGFFVCGLALIFFCFWTVYSAIRREAYAFACLGFCFVFYVLAEKCWELSGIAC